MRQTGPPRRRSGISDPGPPFRPCSIAVRNSYALGEHHMATMESKLGGMSLNLKTRYGNYVAGEWMPPLSQAYFDNVTPITGQTLCEIPRSNAADIERALDAAHAARRDWGKTSAGARAHILEQIADRM